MFFNKYAKEMFDHSMISDIPPVNTFPIWKKTDPYGRDYYGVSHFWSMDTYIEKNCDLSWLEWDGNEVYIADDAHDNALGIFVEAIGIMKAWQTQIQEQFPDDRFMILASFDDGQEMVECNCDRIQSFTLRFWKIREGQGLDETIDINNYDQPVITWISK